MMSKELPAPVLAFAIGKGGVLLKTAHEIEYGAIC